MGGVGGGRLVVTDRGGRDVKRLAVARGALQLGRGATCDVRVLLPALADHHATLLVKQTQAVIRHVSDSGETLVNGRPISVAVLRHGDVITLGDRSLRWEYDQPAHAKILDSPVVAVPRSARGGRGSAPKGGKMRRASAVTTRKLSPELRLALELKHRASAPGGTKQVAIVQPQRRDTSDNQETTPTNARLVVKPHRPYQPSKRRTKSETPNRDNSLADNEGPKRRPSPKNTPKPQELQGTTKATLWIESRKSSPRRAQLTPRRPVASAKKATPLRTIVLRKAVTPAARLVTNARVTTPGRAKVAKIQEPVEIDHMKQAALLLMTGHTPRSNLTNHKDTPAKKNTPAKKLSFKETPVKKQAVKTPKSAKKSPNTTVGARISTRQSAVDDSPSILQSEGTRRSSKRGSDYRSLSVLEITDSDTHLSKTRRTRSQSPGPVSPLLPSPKKSAMKDPFAKKTNRKTESIKFDLSNLGQTNDESDVVFIDTTVNKTKANDTTLEETLTLRFSESIKSPTPRKSIHSRSSRMLESLGTPVQSRTFEKSTLTPESPSPRKSIRGSLMLQKVLERNNSEARKSKSRDSTVLNETRTLTPRQKRDMETYSIVDLVSDGSGTRGSSVYDSVASSTTTFGTPPISNRKTRSTIDPNLLVSSTPYVAKTETKKSITKRNSSPIIRSSDSFQTVASRQSQRSKSLSTISDNKRFTASTKRSASLSTPENTSAIAPLSTRVSRASRRTQIDSDLLILSTDDSPKSSKRQSRVSQKSLNSSKTASPVNLKLSRKSTRNTTQSPNSDGMHTPENQTSPKEIGTPVLSIQSLLDSSQSSVTSISSKRPRQSVNLKRKTIGVISNPRSGRPVKSRSLTATAIRKALLRLSNDSSNTSDKTDEGAPQPSNDDTITPKSTVILVQDAVKAKHSTAKKPQSKRSIIDNLNDSQIVKQLFSSPVKRKLSQSMTEFSKTLHDDMPKKRTRKTTALTGRTPEQTILDNTSVYPTEVFVSPLNTPETSPNLFGIKRLFANSPKNDLTDVRGVKTLLRSRKSIKNDLTNVSGVKKVFARSPKNALINVKGVKEIFIASPENDLRRVSGVKSLFRERKSPKNDLRRVSGVKTLFQERKSPRNDLTNVSGVKKLYKRNSPKDDLRNVSGVKDTLRKSPKNDLRDVRGVKRLFGKEKSAGLSDLSGIEELYDISIQSDKNNKTDTESLFDQLFGKPQIKATYAKSFSKKPISKAKSNRLAKSLNESYDLITNNVEAWLETELKKRAHKGTPVGTSASKSKTPRVSKNVTRELQNLQTDTVEGNEPIRESRIRKSVIEQPQIKSAAEIYSVHTLPIKKRSFVEASLEKSANNSKNLLPIKKRALVHSTPVKGRFDITANVSELGRVSPIVAEKTAESVVYVQNQAKSPPKSKANSPKSKKDTAISLSSQQTLPISKSPSPKKGRTPSKAAIKEAPVSRTRRNTNTNKTTELPNTKKNSTSLVITKKPPVLEPSPKPTRKSRKVAKEDTREESKIETATKVSKTAKSAKTIQKSPPTTPKEAVVTEKRTRNKKEDAKPATPKKTRAKVKNASLVISKPSPKLKPRPVKRPNTKKVEQTPEEPKTRRGRKTDKESKDTEVKKVAETKTESRKTRKTQTVIEKSPEAPKRGRKTLHSTEKPNSRKSRKTVDEKVTEVNNVPEIKTESRNTRKTRNISEKVEVKTPEAPKRGRKTISIPEKAPSKSKANAVENVEVPPKRGRKTESATANTKSKPKDESPRESLPKRGRKTAANSTPENKPANKKIKPAPVENEPSNKTEIQAKRTRNIKVETEITTNTRGKKVTQAEKAETKGKQKKTAETVKKDETPKQTRATRNAPDKAKARNTKDVTVVETKPARSKKDQKSEVVSKSQAKKQTQAAPAVREATRGRKRKSEDNTKGSDSGPTPPKTRKTAQKKPTSPAKVTRSAKPKKEVAKPAATTRSKRR